jgi:YidC/Oxa1 family membrane protein insertase
MPRSPVNGFAGSYYKEKSMEHTRLLLAIAISFLVFFLWSVFFAPPPPSKPIDDPPERITATHDAPLPGREIRDAERAAPAIAAAEAARMPRNISVDTPLYRMTISEKGAAVVSMQLKAYRETIESDSPPKELVSGDLPGGTAWFHWDGPGSHGLENAVYTAHQSPDIVHVSGHPVETRFFYESAEQIRVEKTYRFFPDSYMVDVSVAVVNLGQRSLSGTAKMGLRHLDEGLSGQLGFQGPSGLVNNRLEQVKMKKIHEQNRLEGQLRWVAIEQLYFMDSLIKKDPVEGVMALSYENKVLENQYVIPNIDVPPGGRQDFDFSLFMGPRSLSVLRSVGNDLDRAIHFGWVDFIAKPCLWFMNFLYRFIPNYGFAIIILTIITRLLFWPLAQKSYKSMNAMRKLQPLMQEIREKYKNDKAKMNQETMALYRTYKINPLGGCLPMVIQLPVFFALYRMLYQSIELRHAPFIGWINDLSAPDRLFQFGFSIPFMQEPAGIPVLTLIMGASMFLQMKMSPAPGDPMQAKMMMLMPIVFTFLFINFPSGLVLYWLVSNLVSIGQQYYTLKKLA